MDISFKSMSPQCVNNYTNDMGAFLKKNIAISVTSRWWYILVVVICSNRRDHLKFVHIFKTEYRIIEFHRRVTSSKIFRKIAVSMDFEVRCFFKNYFSHNSGIFNVRGYMPPKLLGTFTGLSYSVRSARLRGRAKSTIDIISYDIVCLIIFSGYFVVRS